MSNHQYYRTVSHLILQTCCPFGVENFACIPTLSVSLIIFSPHRTQQARLFGDDSRTSCFRRLPAGETGGLFVFHFGLFQEELIYRWWGNGQWGFFCVLAAFWSLCLLVGACCIVPTEAARWDWEGVDEHRPIAKYALRRTILY